MPLRELFMKIQTFFFCTIAVCAACGIFTACAPQAAVAVRPDSSGTISFRSALTPAMEKAMRNILGVESGSFFNAPGIRESMSAAGFTVAALSFPSDTGIDITLESGNLNTAFPEALRFISAEKNAFSITISPETAAAAVALMPPETGDYLALLMAPLFTGEEFSPGEYTDLIAVTYGNTLSRELESAVISLAVSLPGTITKASAKGAAAEVSWSGKNALFRLPLTALLTLRGEITCSAEWK
jgi:hypothetical protein